MMDFDIPRWLKDDLGLINMCEADLNGLMFHPRHGTLCRRLIKFLAESTLCNQKYPNVYAKEEYLEAKNMLENKNDDLRKAIKLLEDYVKDNENEERELAFLKLRLDHLRKIEDLQRTSTMALEDLANRPNLEMIACNIEKINYLAKSDLATTYPTAGTTSESSKLSAHQMSAIDEELNDLMKKIETMHLAIPKVLLSITEKMGRIDTNLQPPKTNIQNLVALKLPKFEEQTLDMNPDEKELKDINVALTRRALELDQQVNELSNKYKKKKNDLIEAYKKQLQSSLDILKIDD